ncbi:MAG: GNAT family N-acetyltransferase [Verrucomicrobia bacterium]|nr:GNAT family N-acetyltransferase [Verrucomicrobiota bacterium]
MKQELNSFNQPIGPVVANWAPPSYPERERMTGRFCRLEPLDAASHAESLYAANSLEGGAANWTYLPYGPFDSFESYYNWVDSECGGDDPLFFAIIDLTTGKAVGIASYLRINPLCGSIEVGHLNFSPLLQRKPASTEAMYLMMANAFGLGYRRYEWKCHALNTPSRAAAQRLGISFEGVFRQSTVVKGRSRDTAWYAAIDQEWPGLKNVFESWLSPSNFDDQWRQRTRLSELTGAFLRDC